ncbi:MAG: DNA-3-methyladenine glycosylase 2 family protein, partial [Betaproteobacteria bacterium]|nr:DNA-3-methyladenine glycosylase 2 family protein [Betaproteobacteria bacterium]
MAVAPTATAAIVTTPYFWEEACKHLMKKDRVMKRLIPQFGDACLQTRGDAFVTL